MRKIVRHPKYQAKLNELATRYPGLLDYVTRLESQIAETPTWPFCIYVPAYDVWWSHLLVEDASIPHMRVYFSLDEEEIRFLAILSVEVGSS